MDAPPPALDAPPPREMARLVERLGVAKAQTDTITLAVYWMAYLRGERGRES
jgi:hypothetical protein